ncbi:hypothetical protein Xoosp13_115 [Xanthomonas phage Xoo-sp13]|nr:hypothetical protein Xoosp13_115 [Xanthomonas phage Xoo-sp13]
MIKKELIFTYHSDGTYFSFAPFKSVYDRQARKQRYQLDMYRDLVAERDSASVFILDNTGHELAK